MDQKFTFGRSIAHGDSYLQFIFGHSKVIRLHAKLHDAAGAVRSHSGKRPGYFYDWTRTNFKYAWLRDTTILLLLRKAFAAFHSQLSRLLKE